jgi:hypothetical protein
MECAAADLQHFKEKTSKSYISPVPLKSETFKPSRFVIFGSFSQFIIYCFSYIQVVSEENRMG